MSKPLSFNPDWSLFTLSQSFCLNSGLVLNISSLFKIPSTNCICKDFAKTCDLILYFKKSIISLSDAINAPVLARDLANVAK